mgnify:CR=1 FL=1
MAAADSADGGYRDGDALVEVEVEVDGYGPRPAARYVVACHAAMRRGVLAGDAGGAGDATGGIVWAGAHALAAWLLHAVSSTDGMDGAQYIEFGAGSGLVTVVAATVAAGGGGGGGVVATDGAEAALALNRRTVAAAGDAVARRVVHHVWNWETDGVEALMARVPARPGEARLALLASEVVYPSSTPASMAGLFGAFAALLAHGGPATTAVMSYVQRRASTTHAMLAAAWHAGLTWQAVPWSSYTCHEPPPGARVFLFTLRPADAAAATADSDADFQSTLAATLPALADEVAREVAAVEEAAAAAAEHVFPFAPSPTP